ncbi:glycosyltransferase [Enterococcus hirae]|uniref:glycosyltransferase n=1 Tax=Enterococcus hirae TaxID=1354 RepID=UPI0009BFEFA4|nr:glycosyltransferase [Enterococcus hirae]EMF0307003.1 glycosyltransferase [Enterococcus hirae]EMF0456758.1 glycosyltransferase [Enterococcus hirae]OQO35493.1 glycosyl transferase family 2 [Enterococcus hirae]OQO38664.1 glycosyl transferase family 2 [Enterococcus hirae]OQO57147.1 glycosyl transferase family 2 [Enterococcus hirae]
MTIPKIVVVIVLYQQRFSQSPSFDLLMKAVKEKKIQLVVYDNSPVKQLEPLLEQDKDISYYHDPSNPGLATAYNYALNHAQQNIRYFVTLDHDSQLTATYFDTLLTIDWTDELVAAVPLVYAGSNQISPVFADRYINRQVEKVDRSQLSQRRIMAINSGAVFSIKFLKEIGGFNLDFPLDFLDHWLFWTIYQFKKTIFILPEKMEHDLSVLDYQKVSVTRYQSILKAEKTFYQNYDKEMLPRHRKQLLLRTVKQFLTVRNRKIWRLTLQSFTEN